jgi:hypothetical protein
MTRLAYVMSTSLVVLAIAGRSSVSITPIHETSPADSGSAGAGFRGPVRNTVGSGPISTTSSAEEPIQDSRDENRRPKPERSKR